jgi:hypothetical protein
MLFITDNLLVKEFEVGEKYKVAETINTKNFTVSDTPLTYRQTSTLDKDNLLPKNPNRKKGWRKFSFKELVYVLLVAELKQFGMQHEQLRYLWNCFFREPKKINGKPVTPNKSFADTVIGCIFGKVEMLMTVDKDGKVYFYDPIHFILLREEGSSLVVRVNDIVNKLLKQIGKDSIPIKYSTRSAYLDMVDTETTKKEQVLLNVLRNKDYSTIRVKKSNGQISVIYAGKNSVNTGDITPEELKKIVSEKDFQDINIIKRDGKIVNLTVEETIKP